MYSTNMKLFVKLLVSVLLLCGVRSESCESCYCRSGFVECYLYDCNDVIFEGENIDYMQIHGKLCPKQRETLKKTLFHNTIIQLLDDYCWDIPNCDGLVALSTTQANFPVPPIFPKREQDEDGIDNDPDEPGDRPEPDPDEYQGVRANDLVNTMRSTAGVDINTQDVMTVEVETVEDNTEANDVVDTVDKRITFKDIITQVNDLEKYHVNTEVITQVNDLDKYQANTEVITITQDTLANTITTEETDKFNE